MSGSSQSTTDQLGIEPLGEALGKEYVARFFGPTNIIPAYARDGVFDTPLGEVVSPLASGNGGRVLLSVRPSDIGPSAGGVSATVLRGSYRGSYTEFTAALKAGDGSAIEVSGHAPLCVHLSLGQSVELRVREGGVQLLEGTD